MRLTAALMAMGLAALVVPLLAGAASRPDLAASSNRFAFDLHRGLRERPGNQAFSPASIFAALVMPWSGARGPTADEMARALHLASPPEAVLPEAAALIRSLERSEKGPVTLRVANRLFAERSYTFEAPWLAGMRQMGAPLEQVDYRHAPEAARVRVNAWVEEQTNERIRDLLPRGSVTKDTRLALVNAIYLLADWLSPFESEATRPRPFHAGGGAPKDVPTMHATQTFPYAERPGLQVLQMPYAGGELAMVVLLPAERDGIAELERRLDADALAAHVAALAPERVSVALPKFTVDLEEPLALKPELERLGMRLAFDRRLADFTGIAAPPDPQDRLFVTEVFHKAFVKVDEKGTEAAAATATLMARATSVLVEKPPKKFVADRPFLFLIRDTRSGLILFLGRVTDPAA